MKPHSFVAGVLCVVAFAALAVAQAPTGRAQFLGTWSITMTDPPEMRGAHQTIRIWEDHGVLAASVQIGRFPALQASSVYLDGDMLMVVVSHAAQKEMIENGVPIWAVFALTKDGDTLKTAQMMERSATNKRGSGQRQQ
jgi:hypothetical protein